jgi:muramoyltetrapeptide carboxypeptidase
MPSIIHLIAPAGNLKSFYEHLDVQNARQMIDMFQQWTGNDFTLSGDPAILDAEEDEARSGRSDDEARARDITAALADDKVAAIIAVRGGAWFTRILPRIDFSVLDRRSSRVSVFGFSELTPLVNIIASHPMGRGFHDMGPAFLVYGLKRHAAQVLKFSDTTDPTPQQWMQQNLLEQIAAYLRDVVQVLKGAPTPPISARLVRGQLQDGATATFVGGNLTVLSTMIGSQFAQAVSPDNRWIVLEDFNDKPERLDRFLAHLTLAGYWDRCSGLLLGDFHRGDTDLLPAILTMLDYHLPNQTMPVLTTRQVGHIWPMTPLPINHPGRWNATGSGNYEWICH